MFCHAPSVPDSDPDPDPDPEPDPAPEPDPRTTKVHFDDNEALFLAVVQSRMPTILEPNDTLISSFPGTTRELLTHLLQFMYGKLVDSDIRVLMRIIIAEGNKFPELVELYHREAASKGLSLLERVVARGVARGEVKADHAPLLHMTIVAPVMMAAIWRMTFDSQERIESEDFIEAHLDLLFNAPFETDSASS